MFLKSRASNFFFLFFLSLMAIRPSFAKWPFGLTILNGHMAILCDGQMPFTYFVFECGAQVCAPPSIYYIYIYIYIFLIIFISFLFSIFNFFLFFSYFLFLLFHFSFIIHSISSTILLFVFLF